jgi:adenosylmethionine-8-amino-7-oxononanoate aminotransferase
VFFTTGGSTAVDSALRFVQFYFNFTGKPQKKHIITREYAYHGSTYLSASVSGKPSDRGYLDFVSDTIHHLPVPNTYRRPEGMTEEEFCDQCVGDLEKKIIELGPDKVACFIAEPLLASGGVIVPPKGYQKRTFDICRKYDVLYISDEVVTGFGRLGHIFASEPVFGIVPDIITSAKGLTSGYVPLGAFFVSDRLYDQLTGPDPGQDVHGFTNPSAPAPPKNLEIMRREPCAMCELGPISAVLETLRTCRWSATRGGHLVRQCVTDKPTRAAEWARHGWPAMPQAANRPEPSVDPVAPDHRKAKSTRRWPRCSIQATTDDLKEGRAP